MARHGVTSYEHPARENTPKHTPTTGDGREQILLTLRRFGIICQDFDPFSSSTA
jgi:hypothetical protein